MKENKSSEQKSRIVKEVQVTPVKPDDGLIAFCSFVLYEAIYCSSVAVYTRLDGSGCRLVYPVREISGKQMDIFHPINPELGRKIELEVDKKLQELKLI